MPLTGVVTSLVDGLRHPPHPKPRVLHTPPKLVHVAVSTSCDLPTMLQYCASHLALVSMTPSWNRRPT